MSKEVDALVLIGHARIIADEVPPYVQPDIAQGLWYARNADYRWNDGRSMRLSEVQSMYAGEVLLQLGGLMANRYMLQLPEQPQQQNPMRDAALDVIDDVSPFATSGVLRPDFVVTRPNVDDTERLLPSMFNTALATEPLIFDELEQKWRKAQAVHRRHGRIMMMGYEETSMQPHLTQMTTYEAFQQATEGGVKVLANALAELKTVSEAISPEG